MKFCRKVHRPEEKSLEDVKPLSKTDLHDKNKPTKSKDVSSISKLNTVEFDTVFYAKCRMRFLH